MAPRLRSRRDIADVLQEAYLELVRDLDAYLAEAKLPPAL